MPSTHNQGAFLNLPADMSDPRDARAVVLPVPYEATTSYVRGTARGPRSILAASAQVEWYDEARGDEPCRRGISTLAPLDCDGAPEDVVGRIAGVVEAHVGDGRFVLALGGEHTLTVGCAAGAEAAGPLTIVQIDAHADLRDEYQGSPWSHACVMRRLAGRFPIVQIGIRSMSAEEAAFSEEANGLLCVTGREIAAARCEPGGCLVWVERAVQAIETERVYLSVDLDGLDPSVVPAVGTPEPGGLLWNEALAFVRTLFESRKVVSADVVELCPRSGTVRSDFAAARLAYKIVGHALRA
ncbi:MAG: agmatinase [Candidatus Eisenbacteria bacterium]|nr:agmatinase [Candidatus Eisenbacteria bacterium]